MIKKLLALILCMALVLSLAACGGSGDKDDKDTDGGTFAESTIKLPDYKPTSDKVTLLGTGDM